MERAMIPNPHHAGAPARMADGRLFTDYRPNCDLMAPLKGEPFAEYKRKEAMLKNAQYAIATDRNMLVMRAGSAGCVDTMVPELNKRIYAWNGPVGEVLAQPAGLGTGRMYLPGQPGLAAADPDILAAATFPEMPGTFSMMRAAAPMSRPSGTPQNRYSGPHD
jgi:hypothetical protein